MLKKASSFVLAVLGGSTYREEYAFASSLAAAALGALFEHPAEMLCRVIDLLVPHLQGKIGFSTAY
jgi:hypothetical protein